MDFLTNIRDHHVLVFIHELLDYLILKHKIAKIFSPKCYTINVIVTMKHSMRGFMVMLSNLKNNFVITLTLNHIKLHISAFCRETCSKTSAKIKVTHTVTSGGTSGYKSTKGCISINTIEHQYHISINTMSIDGEYIPLEGDEVTYKLCPIPPKREKCQATHVRIINFTPEVHHRWDSPCSEDAEHC
ncbi:unnamed protein product, partial [Meganyctiphanes norvegica]